MDLKMQINLKDIDLKKIKTFFKKKETLIAVGIITFIIGIVVAGNFLIGDYREAQSKQDMTKRKYEKILTGDTDVNSLQQKIDNATQEINTNSQKLSLITPKDVGELLISIQNDTGVKWGESGRTISIKENIKDAPELKAIVVTIPKFSAKYSAIKEFMRYIDDFYREVSIDVLNFSKDKLTGDMSGSMTLTFYMKNDEATGGKQ